MTEAKSHSLRDVVIATVAGTVIGGLILAGLGKLAGTVSWIGHRAVERYSITLPLWLWLLVGAGVLLLIRLRRRGQSSAMVPSHERVNRQREEAIGATNIVTPDLPKGPPLPSTGLDVPSARNPTPAWAPDITDKRRWLRETSAQAIADQLRPVPPLKRKAVAKELFVGAWVRWAGEILDAKEGAESGSSWMLVNVEGGGQAFLNFSKDEYHFAANCHVGDRVRFEARVKKLLDNLSPDLDSVRLLPLDAI